MPTALLKFSQGASVGADGQAFFGNLSAAFGIANSDNTGVGSWEITVLEVPYGSATPVGVLAAANGASPIASIAPDALGGCYRIQLKVWASSGQAGDLDTDIRCIGLLGTNGMCAPPPQVWPLPLPDPRLGIAGAKPNEMNFGGQDDGWAGNGADGLLRHAIRFIGRTPNSILTFTQATSLYEIGTVLANPAFAATYTAAPTALTLTNNQNGENRNVLSTPSAPASAQSYTFTLGYSVTFTLHYTNGETDTKTLTKQAAQLSRWGVSSSPVATEAFIEGLANSALDTDAARTFVQSPGPTEYICFAHPTRYGTPTFLIGGVLPGGYISLGTTISVTNAQGFTENFTLWRSVTAGLAPNTSTTVQN